LSSDTPLMRQYREIKARYPGSILFFRMGDFYEMFGDDALVASKALEITLTARNKASDEPVPLCGVPYHASEIYISKLIKKGFNVAVCEQVEDPRSAKGIVKREVIRVITPGTLLEDNLLSASENNFLMSISLTRKKAGIAFLDISTGEFYVTELPEDASGRLLDEIAGVGPKEILLPKGGVSKGPLAEVYSRYKDRVNLTDDWGFDPENGRQRLIDHFGVASLEGFGIEGMDAGIAAAGAAFGYLQETQAASLANITRARAHNLASHMLIDETARRNLEVTESPSGSEGTLLNCLDDTVTAMGARRLKDWLVRPLLDVQEIRARHEAVEELTDNFTMRRRLRDNLKGIHDIERLMGRISSGVAGPRDFASLRVSVSALPVVKDTVFEAQSQRLKALHGRISLHKELKELIECAVVDEPPATMKDGGIIKEGYSSELDELRGYASEGKGLIARIEAEERANTGITSLKVRFNKVFGYYIEITKSNLEQVPDYFIRKQTLVNAERYITPELKEYEEKVLGAEEKILELETSLFSELRTEAARHAPELQKTAEALAEMDALASFAEAASSRGYVRPDVDDGDELDITDGRHPVVELLIGRERYVPNDTRLDSDASRLVIITGPNMAGKSTYMRQVALIVLMAQCGSFVPASSAKLGIVDRIFTRVGASDNIARGQSTFMVEMNETANILNNATCKSLIILDEIGRGTSAFDGLSIAWAVAEYIHDKDKVGAKTLFATHYHELTELALDNPGIRNCNIAVKEWKDEIVFLRKIVEGGADKSYGIQVARLAGLPRELLERAKQILAELERREFDDSGRASTGQMDLFAAKKDDSGISDELAALDIDNITPIEALKKLAEFKERLSGGS